MIIYQVQQEIIEKPLGEKKKKRKATWKTPSSSSSQIHLFDFSLLIPNKRSPGWVGVRTPIMEWLESAITFLDLIRARVIQHSVTQSMR